MSGTRRLFVEPMVGGSRDVHGRPLRFYREDTIYCQDQVLQEMHTGRYFIEERELRQPSIETMQRIGQVLSTAAQLSHEPGVPCGDPDCDMCEQRSKETTT